MPLDKPALSVAIKTLLDEMSNRTDGPELARQNIADGLADAFDAFVKSGTVTVTTSIGLTDGALQIGNLGAPTGPPLVPVDLAGTGSVT